MIPAYPYNVGWSPLGAVAAMCAALVLLAGTARAEAPSGSALVDAEETQLGRLSQTLPGWKSLLKPEWRAALRTDEKAAWRRVPKSVLKRLRGVAADLADLQQDVYDEDWQNLAIYPNLFQAYLPAFRPKHSFLFEFFLQDLVFTRYTDSAFPSTSPVDESLRFSLRYEVGAFFRHLRELEAAAFRKDMRPNPVVPPPGAEEASALMSLSYDRYLKAGDLYEGYDKDGGEDLQLLLARTHQQQWGPSGEGRHDEHGPLARFLNGSSLANATVLRFAAMVPSGAIADAVGSTIRVPFELMNKQVQAGKARNFSEAFDVVFNRPGASKFYFASWTGTAILVRDVPYGTLQLVFFEFFKESWGCLDTCRPITNCLSALLQEFTPEYLEPLGFNLFAQRLVWGFLAGLQGATGALRQEDSSVVDLVKDAASGIWKEKGLEGFFVGGAQRALYYAPVACLFFALYDTLVNII
eukprot:Skav205662  [mRNA]  locus=scaffold458:317293:332839:+ [translate_table: standard]